MKFFFGGIFSTTILAMLAGYWYVCVVKQHCIEKDENKLFEEKELKEAYGAMIGFEDNVFIYQNDSSVQFSNASFKKLTELVKFSKDNPEIEIIVNGYYTENEEKLLNGKNYGTARANSFKKLLIEKGVADKSIKIISTINNDLFDASGKANGKDALDFNFSDIFPALTVLEMKQGYKNLFELEKAIFFRKNDSKVAFRPGTETAIANMQYYMNRHDEQKISLNSLYQKDERIAENFPNIGESRANSFVEQVEKKNLKKEKLIPKNKVGHKLFNKMEQAKQKAFSFNFILPDPSDTTFLSRKKLEEKLEEAFTVESQEEVVADLTQDVDINFKLGSDRLFVSPEIIQYVEKLKQHLSDYPSQKVYITGHTCNRGSDKFNKELGFNRAGSAMLMLKDNGIAEDKIIFSSKGELEPIYSNDNAEGQEKNRRIQIEIN